MIPVEQLYFFTETLSKEASAAAAGEFLQKHWKPIVYTGGGLVGYEKLKGEVGKYKLGREISAQQRGH
jgi:hypothetical protein